MSLSSSHTLPLFTPPWTICPLLVTSQWSLWQPIVRSPILKATVSVGPDNGQEETGRRQNGGLRRKPASTQKVQGHSRPMGGGEDSILAHPQGGKNSLLTLSLIEKLLHWQTASVKLPMKGHLPASRGQNSSICNQTTAATLDSTRNSRSISHKAVVCF